MNEKAFPKYCGESGMDLLDYFAAKAMMADIMNWSPENAKSQDIHFWSYEEIAKRAYLMAEAMEKARFNFRRKQIEEMRSSQ